jgi:hypothetical protein
VAPLGDRSRTAGAGPQGQSTDTRHDGTAEHEALHVDAGGGEGVVATLATVTAHRSRGLGGATTGGGGTGSLDLVAAAVTGGVAAVVAPAVTGRVAAVAATAVTGRVAVVVTATVTGRVAAVVTATVTGRVAAVVTATVTRGVAVVTGVARTGAAAVTRVAGTGVAGAGVARTGVAGTGVARTGNAAVTRVTGAGVDRTGVTAVAAGDVQREDLGGVVDHFLERKADDRALGGLGGGLGRGRVQGVGERRTRGETGHEQAGRGHGENPLLGGHPTPFSSRVLIYSEGMA